MTRAVGCHLSAIHLVVTSLPCADAPSPLRTQTRAKARPRHFYLWKSRFHSTIYWTDLSSVHLPGALLEFGSLCLELHLASYSIHGAESLYWCQYHNISIPVTYVTAQSWEMWVLQLGFSCSELLWLLHVCGCVLVLCRMPLKFWCAKLGLCSGEYDFSQSWKWVISRWS